MTRYTCPMHPEISGAEGDRCPRCNMALVPEGAAAGHAHHGHVPAAKAAPAAPSCCQGPADHAAHGHHHGHAPAKPAAAAPGTQYTCPMHPDVVQDKPGACPDCGMALEPMTPAMPRTWPSMRRRRVTQVVWTACRMLDIYPLGVYAGKRKRGRER